MAGERLKHSHWLAALTGCIAALAAPTAALGQGSQPESVCARALRQAAVEDRAVSDMLGAEADYARMHDGQLSPRLLADFVDWYGPKHAQDPDNYPSLAATYIPAEDQTKRRRAVEEFLAQHMQDIRAAMAARKAKVARACPGRKAPE